MGAGSWELGAPAATGSWELEAGSWGLETGAVGWGAGGWERELGAGSLNWELGAGILANRAPVKHFRRTP